MKKRKRTKEKRRVDAPKGDGTDKKAINNEVVAKTNIQKLKLLRKQIFRSW